MYRGMVEGNARVKYHKKTVSQGGLFVSSFLLFESILDRHDKPNQDQHHACACKDPFDHRSFA